MPGIFFGENTFRVLVQLAGMLTVLALGFAAYTLVLRSRNERRLALWRRLEARWTPLLLRALEDPERLPELRDAVEDRYGLFFVNFALRYSRRIRGEEREILERAVAPYLDRVARRATSERIEHRARAVQTLGALGLPRYADLLVEALDDPSPLVAMVAARALATGQRAEHAPAILRRIRRFRTWRDTTLASLLAEMGGGAGPALREALGDEEADPWMRALAAETLLRMRDLESADIAAHVLERSEDRELVSSALRLLGEVGRAEHLPVVRARCASPDFVIRARALRDLGRLGGREEVGRLGQALSDPSPWAALQAARGLLEAGGAAALESVASSGGAGATVARQVLAEEAGGGSG